jgi:Domain of unknown function (DUF4334)
VTGSTIRPSDEFRDTARAAGRNDGVSFAGRFKQVDRSTMMGIMNGESALNNARHLYFGLERV